MELNIKTILKFALIAVVAYASRPLSDAIMNSFVGDNKNIAEKSKNKIPVSGAIDGHDYVDLGLSVKWATCNVGASNYTRYGSYFAWGETEPKKNYSWKTYMWCNGGYETINKYRYGFDNETVLESLDDAATVNWGEKWRMPTIAELQELENNCTWEWKIINGVNGYKITAKNNNWIFLPAAGYRYGTSGRVDSCGNYWSSTVYESDNNDAYSLSFYSLSFRSGTRWRTHTSSSKRTSRNVRDYGLTVRPVSDNVVVDDNVD